MSGWQLNDTAERSLSRFWNMTRSQIYLELGRLESAGLIESSGAEGPRARRPYRVTAAGRRVFRDWLASWVGRGPRDDQLHSPLVLTVFFGDFIPEQQLRQLLEEYRLRHRRLLATRRAMEDAISSSGAARMPTATLRRGIRLHEMTVAWIEETLATLDRSAVRKKQTSPAVRR